MDSDDLTKDSKRSKQSDPEPGSYDMIAMLGHANWTSKAEDVEIMLYHLNVATEVSALQGVDLGWLVSEL